MQMQFPEAIALHRTSLSSKTAECSNEWMNFRVRLMKKLVERLIRGSLSRYRIKKGTPLKSSRFRYGVYPRRALGHMIFQFIGNGLEMIGRFKQSN
jgi:hypothetical protein